MRLLNHTSGHTVEIGGARIYYETTGNDAAPALLFIHGGFGNMEDFNTLLPRLERPFHIIGIDSRAQGRSTRGGEVLSYERLQRDVEAVLARLGLDTLSIVGFSDGGIVGYRLAAFSNLTIQKLVTIGSRWHTKDAESTREILQGVNGASWRVRFPEMYAVYERLNPEPDFDELAAALVAMWLEATPSGHPNEAIAGITCPTLVVRGDEDHLVSRRTVFDAAERIEGAALFNLPFAGHAAFMDQPESFMTGLNAFLNS